MLFLKLIPTLIAFALALLEYNRQSKADSTDSGGRSEIPVIPTLILVSTLAATAVIWSEDRESAASAERISTLLSANKSLEEKASLLTSELEKWKTSRTTGRIIPANEPRPQHRCGPIPDDALALFFGDSVAWVSKRSNRIPLMSMGGQTVIELNRDSDGVSLSAIVFRSDGRGIATIVDNEFGINPNNFFKNVSADAHELAIRDKDQVVVLRARFLNENTFQITGQFSSPVGVLSVTESGTSVGGATFSGECLADNVIESGIFGF